MALFILEVNMIKKLIKDSLKKAAYVFFNKIYTVFSGLAFMVGSIFSNYFTPQHHPLFIACVTFIVPAIAAACAIIIHKKKKV